MSAFHRASLLTREIGTSGSVGGRDVVRPALPVANSFQIRVLIIDDDVKLCALLRDFLEGEGFQVLTENTGLVGLRRASEADLVVLDMMLPDIDGAAILRRVRLKSMIPVIVITARGDEEDRIDGLEAGADDFLAKPFNPRELSARIRAIWRRTRVQLHATARGPIQIGDSSSIPARGRFF